MAEEFDTATGNIVVQESPRSDPTAVIAYRSGVSTADGATKPAAGSALWLVNPGYRAKARVFVETTGSPSGCTVRPYLRCGGTSGAVGTGTAYTLAGAPNFDVSFDVQADGDDLA